MKDLSGKFSKPQDFMLDVFGRVRFTAKSCLLQDRRRRLARGEKDSACMDRSMAKLEKVVSFQLLNDNFDYKGEK